MFKMKLNFTKMHGSGNDFIMVDARRKKIKNPGKLAKKLCRRHYGVGADGLILVLTSKKADYRMRIMNADGSEAEMCGNGIRCFAKFIKEKGISKKEKLRVETLAGIIKPELVGNEVMVDMGEPRLSKKEIPMIGNSEPAINEDLEINGGSVHITALSMGNPHAVIFVPELDTYPFEKVGHEVERNSNFPNKTNVEFVEVLSKKEIEIKVWERGVGPTLACGTGACAAVVASSLNGKTGRKVKANLPGGKLTVEWSQDDNHVYMAGPAETVYEGTVTV
jgi:diaminopimelate epimerase